MEIGPKDAQTDEPRLVLGDCRRATAIAPDLVGGVALVVTSPPYHNAIDYDSHAEDATANYRTRGHLSYSQDYMPLLNEAWAACWQMLRPGGYMAINVGTVLLDGYQFPLPQDITFEVLHAPQKWYFVRSIVWHKVTAGVKRAGVVIQKPLPGYWYPNIMTEHIMVFQKPGRPTKVTPDPDVPDEWWQPVWDLAPVPPRSVPHPAPFPEDLPHRLIRMLTNPGDVVMDPFNGAGATSKAAFDLDRVPLGFDLENQYLDYARKRLAGPSAVRSEQLRVKPAKTSSIEGPTRSSARTRHGAGLATRTKRGPA